MTAGPPPGTCLLRRCPLPRARCRSVRFFTHLRGTGPLAAQAREARPDPQAPGKGGPASARAYGLPAMPGPAPGRTPAKQPPAAHHSIHAIPAALMHAEKEQPVARNRS
jgi:hypothetical protein